MYQAHYRGIADKPGMRGLGVMVRDMSPDNMALSAVQAARECGISGVWQQQALADLLLAKFNPVDVPACDNVVTGTDKYLWGSRQAVKNSLRDLILNNMSDGQFYRCDRSGNPVGETRAYGYFVVPFSDDELNIHDAWELIQS